MADDEPENTEIANDVKEFIIRGLIVERVTHDFVRSNSWGCKCKILDKSFL